MTANEWRVRTSCCAALSDLLKSGGQRSLTDPNVLPIVPQLWTQLFRVMDDVHEGTRKAAEATCQVLSKVCLRYCDPTHGSNSSEQMLHALIPILLENGITNTVPKVRSIRYVLYYLKDNMYITILLIKIKFTSTRYFFFFFFHLLFNIIF